MENLEIYEKYREVPPEALKDFDTGNFSGTDINDMWRIECLTKEFGPVGIGWNIKVLKLWTEVTPRTGETLAYAHISLEYKYNGEWSRPIEATGGSTMEAYVKSKDYFKSSDEAYKMAITDALSVACKYLGIGANIYLRNGKSKYTKDEKQKEPKGKETKKVNPYTEALKVTFKVKDKTYILGELTEDNLRVIIEREGMPEEIKEAARIILNGNQG